MKTLQRYCVALCALGCLTLLGTTQTADASHFRGGYIVYTPTGTPGEVQITAFLYARRSIYGAPNVGDNIGDATFFFGDGSTDGGTWEVVAINTTDDWVVARKVMTHMYADPNAEYLAGWDSGDRVNNGSSGIFPDGIGNRANQDYRVVARITPTNTSPQTSSGPFVGVPRSTTASYQVPVVATGDPFQCRFATEFEAIGGSADNTMPTDNPPNMTINDSTCLIEWDNDTLPAGFYTTQVIIEELDPNGRVKGTVPLDILFQIGAQNATNSPPVCTIEGTPLGGGVTQVNATVGAEVQFDVTGTDSDAGQTLEISATSVPAGLSASPMLPTSGASPVMTTVSYTPATAGSQLATFTISDGDDSVLCTARIVATVANDVCLDPAMAPSYAGGYVLNAAGTRAFVVLEAPRGATMVRFYNTNNLNVGDPETDAESGTPIAFDNRTGDTFSFSSDPTMLYFPVTPAGSGTQVSFFVEVSDECGSIDVDPAFTITGVTRDALEGFALSAAAPSPTTARATLRFSLKRAAHVTLTVYDTMGRQVATLVEGSLPSGTHEAIFDGASLPSGLYLYRLNADGQTLQKTLTIAR